MHVLLRSCPHVFHLNGRHGGIRLSDGNGAGSVAAERRGNSLQPFIRIDLFFRVDTAGAAPSSGETTSCLFLLSLPSFVFVFVFVVVNSDSPLPEFRTGFPAGVGEDDLVLRWPLTSDAQVRLCQQGAPGGTKLHLCFHQQQRVKGRIRVFTFPQLE